ncbi:hypothetical protein QQS21_012115 [Conoideocrella luteorostrata]|uniref:Uncharacterized protein n=1 Tax=Conoideocrella luteorostrata TaxID=1105319 RepID=A0AAJ0CGC4_9HYPO|nr:hypothetical protein QQS21_012115 [Conoideocrella luteorostrata]
MDDTLPGSVVRSGATQASEEPKPHTRKRDRKGVEPRNEDDEPKGKKPKIDNVVERGLPEDHPLARGVVRLTQHDAAGGEQVSILNLDDLMGHVAKNQLNQDLNAIWWMLHKIGAVPKTIPRPRLNDKGDLNIPGYATVSQLRQMTRDQLEEEVVKWRRTLIPVTLGLTYDQLLQFFFDHLHSGDTNRSPDWHVAFCELESYAFSLLYRETVKESPGYKLIEGVTVGQLLSRINDACGEFLEDLEKLRRVEQWTTKYLETGTDNDPERTGLSIPDNSVDLVEEVSEWLPVVIGRFVGSSRTEMFHDDWLNEEASLMQPSPLFYVYLAYRELKVRLCRLWKGPTKRHLRNLGEATSALVSLLERRHPGAKLLSYFSTMAEKKGIDFEVNYAKLVLTTGLTNVEDGDPRETEM